MVVPLEDRDERVERLDCREVTIEGGDKEKNECRLIEQVGPSNQTNRLGNRQR